MTFIFFFRDRVSAQLQNTTDFYTLTPKHKPQKMSNTYTQNFSIGPKDRQFVGSLIGKGGSNLTFTKDTCGVSSIRYDNRQSQFIIKGGVRACERATKLLAEKLEKLINNPIHYAKKSVMKLHNLTSETPSPKQKSATKSKKKNLFECLVSDDGRTVEEVEEEKVRKELESKIKAKEAKVMKPKSKKNAWFDMTDDESDDEE